MLMLHETVPFVRPSSCQDLKLSEKSTSVFHCKLGCSAVCCSAEGHHVQKPHFVHSHKVSFTRTSHLLCRSLNERTTRHWLVFLALLFAILITVFFPLIKAFCCMQHRFHVNASPDDEFRSSRNIAISLFKRYKNIIDRGGCGENLKVLILVESSLYLPEVFLFAD